MHNALALLSGGVAIIAALPYIRDVLRHKTKHSHLVYVVSS
jgi:hypothetical protein